MIETKQGNGILVFDTNPTCAEVYVDNKLYGTTEKDLLQIMNVNQGRYTYSLQLNNKQYDNDIYVQMNKISHVYYNFNTNVKEEESVDIGSPITNFAKKQESQQKNKIPFPDESNEPILKDESITVSKHVDYYDVSNTITTASATDPHDFDSPVYNKEEIYKIKGRYAEKITVLNDGSATLYVIISHGKTAMNYSKEVPIYAGEAKIYYNVYELKLRSATAGHPYRVAEYEIRSINAILKGSDGTNLVTVAVDASGNIIAVMKGTDGVNLRTVSVDVNGQIIMVPRGSNGNYLNVDTNGFLSALIKGNFQGTLKTVSVDTSGRIEAFIQGNIPTSGPVIFYDDFEASTFKWTSTGYTSAGLTIAKAWSGDKSMYLNGNGSVRTYGYIRTNNKLALDVTFMYATATNFSFYFTLYDGTNQHTGSLRYGPTISKWQYLNSIGGYTDVPGGTQNLASDVWHRLHAEYDFSTNKYGTFKSDNLQLDLSAISCQTVASITGVQLQIAIFSDDELWIDNVLVIEL